MLYDLSSTATPSWSSTSTQALKLINFFFNLLLLLLFEKKNDGIKLTNDLILKRINLTDYIITPLYILK